MVTYGTTVIPSDQIEVLEGSSVAVSVAFENSIGLVGGMDTDSGTATTGDVVEVRGTSDAADKFGSESELHMQAQHAFQNGAATVYALPVEETTESESVTSSASGTLDNAPIMDPNVHSEHSITVTDGSGQDQDVGIVYGDPQVPTEADVQINLTTGEWSAAASGDYTFDYTHGDYSAGAVSPLLDESPRIVGVCTENVSVVNDVVSELNSRATDFDFMQMVAGASPNISDTSSYSSSVDERRASLVYPSRGFTDAAETTQARVVGAVGGYLASLPLGISSTNDEIGGFTGLLNDLSGPTDAGDLIDAGVMPLLDYPPVTIVSDQTTSSTSKFGRIYAMQIVDEATEVSHSINREYIGDQNVVENRIALRRAHRNVYNSMTSGTPRLLDDYTVNVSESSTDDNTVEVEIGIDVVDVMDTIDVTITVGDIIRSNTQS